jgi:subfamily B ATP-binding cassette protein MsbA
MKLYFRLLKYLRPYWMYLAAAGLCAGAISGLTAAQAWLVKPVLDGIFINKDVRLLHILPIAIVAVSLFKGLFNYGQAYLMSYAGNRVIKNIRDGLYRHLVLMPVGFYTRHSTGQLISRVLNDVGTMQMSVSTLVKNIFQQILTLIALTVVVFYQDWRMAIIAVLVLPLAYYPIMRLGRRLRSLGRSNREKIADISSILQETFSGIRAIKAFGMEEFETERFKEKGQGYLKNIMKSVRLSEGISPLMELVGSLGVSLIIWYGGSRVIHGQMTVGAFTSFMAACWMMYAPLRSLGTANNTLQQTLASAERVFEIMDAETEQVHEGVKEDLPVVCREIEFKNVSFQYEDTRVETLSNINLRIKAGEMLAIVGSSGSGKTSLVNLLPRFYHPTEGAILMDGTDIRQVRLNSLRRQIGIVSQETFLFDDTVRNNIAYGLKDPSLDKIIEAAKAAYAHSFIMKMPQGYDTQIGERGVKLSGGEKQRLAIARALLKNPPILVLDEATSSLDTESEYMVQQALANLMKGRTTFVIAHRLSTIQNAHRIVVIDQGRIVEMGRHEELLKTKGVYHRLYQMQFKDEEETVRVDPGGR